MATIWHALTSIRRLPNIGVVRLYNGAFFDYLRWVFVQARAADSVFGAWRLIALTEEETANKVDHEPRGEHSLGLIIFTADGHMSFIMADRSPKAAAAP